MKHIVFERRVCRLANLAAVLALFASFAQAQEARSASPSDNSSAPATASGMTQASGSDIHALVETVTSLEAEVHALSSQLADVRAAQARSDQEVRSLQEQLLRAEEKTAVPPVDQSSGYGPPAADSQQISATPMNSASQEQNQPENSESLGQLQEDQELLNSKVVEQSQTKVESGSKYRVRFSGMILFNVFENRGTVDNTDFPAFALESEQPFSSASFGGSLRQSQMGVDVFGPNISGARTSASINFDFAGGFTQGVPNGETMGIVRLRTAVIRFDWTNTSIVAGQDHLFFVPNAPTSLAVQATPALSYAGNIWSWTPQIRVEHKVPLSDKSSMMLEAGILDSLSGDWPSQYQYAYASWGEQSGQPGYAARVAWTHALFGQDLTLGAGGYYGRQFWGYGRNVDGWVSSEDVQIPLSSKFSLSGAFYRGRAVGGFWGAFGQDVLMSGSMFDPSTTIKGLDSMGGWMQLKFKPRANFQINGAYGDDNPFASELDRFPAGQSFYGYSFTRNQSPFANFIYQARSNVEFSVEYRRLRTMVLHDDTNTANHYNASVAYKF